MKMPSAKAKISGLTLIEVLLVLVVIVFLAALLFPAHSRAHIGNESSCVNHLKEIDFGFQMWAEDNGGVFPWQNSNTNGGTMEYAVKGYAAPNFQILSNFVKRPERFICPADKVKLTAADYTHFNNQNVSYFANADAGSNNPLHSILAGDRNLQANGQSVKPGLFELTTNLDMSWTHELHLGRGCLAFADGHVEIVTSNGLNSIVQNQPLATNRLCIP